MSTRILLEVSSGTAPLLRRSLESVRSLGDAVPVVVASDGVALNDPVEQVGAEAADLDRALADGKDWFALLRAGDIVLPAWSAMLGASGSADVIYGDSLLLDPVSGRGSQIFARPEWSPELFLGLPYPERAVAVRRTAAIAAGAFRDGFPGATLYDLLLRMTERSAAVRHVSGPVIGEIDGGVPLDVAGRREAVADALRRRLDSGTVEITSNPGACRVRRDRKGELVSIIIPTRDRVDLLRPCVESLRRTIQTPYELVIVDNDSQDPATLGYLNALEATVVRYPGPFNFAEMNNRAAERAQGSTLLLLNNDTEAGEPGWLESLLDLALAPEIGAVGAQLLYPDGSIQHAGMAIDSAGRVGQLLAGQDPAGLSHPYLLRAAMDVSAVTGACMMIRRDLFLSMGGFDPTLAVCFNDIDLCLRLRERGYRVVFTPFATLLHHECASRVPYPPLADEVLFRARWMDTPLSRDPCLSAVRRMLGDRVAIPGGLHGRTELDSVTAGDAEDDSSRRS